VLEYGVRQQVLIATSTTLIGLLRAVHYGWRHELIAESAREIAGTGREVHRRLAVFAEPLAKVGRQLGSAVVAYNEAVGSFDRRVVPQLRRIEAAGASSEKRGLRSRPSRRRRGARPVSWTMARRARRRGSQQSTQMASTMSRRPCTRASVFARRGRSANRSYSALLPDDY
jgi:DNA anti-recombination protein RmuC